MCFGKIVAKIHLEKPNLFRDSCQVRALLLLRLLTPSDACAAVVAAATAATALAMMVAVLSLIHI